MHANRATTIMMLITIIDDNSIHKKLKKKIAINLKV